MMMADIAVEQTCIAQCLETAKSPVFWYGALVGCILGLIIWTLLRCYLCNGKKVRSISVEDSEKGGYLITLGALQKFVKHLKSDSSIEIESIHLVETRLGLVLNVVIRSQANADLLTLRREFRNRIFEELQKKLGITDQLYAINFETVDFTEEEA